METVNESTISNSTIQNDNSICEICKSQPSKYKCPRCHLRSCSVTCVKQHKLDQLCSGERSKTHFIPLKQYNESNMMSDYVYLEDISRCSDNMTRQRLTDQPFVKMDPKKKAVIKHARASGIIYDMLPSGMSKHKLNRTNYSLKCRRIFWTIEFVFCLDDKKERILEHACIEIKTLREILNNILFSDKPQGKNSYATIRYQLRHFIEASMDQWSIGLKKEGGNNRNTFTNLTTLIDDKLTTLLKYERIIEYPTINIWLKDHVDPSLQLVDKQKVDLPKNNTADVDKPLDNNSNKMENVLVVEEEEQGDDNDDNDDNDDDNDDNDDDNDDDDDDNDDDGDENEDNIEEKKEENNDDGSVDETEKKDKEDTVEDINEIIQVKDNHINNVKSDAYDNQGL